MLSSIRLFRFILTLITCVSGTAVNFSMLAVQLLERQPRPGTNSGVYDKILLSTVVINISLQVCLTVEGMLDTVGTMAILGKDAFLAMFVLQFSLFYASSWNTAWLSIFYYIRLVNLSHPCLLKAKSMFLSSVPQLIMGSVLSSVIINLPFFWVTQANVIQNRTLTTSMSGYETRIHNEFTMFNSLVGFLLPLTLTCLCIGQCVLMLLRHVWRIKLNESHLTSPQLQGHVRAIITMVMRVALDLTFYLIILVSLLTSFHLPVIFSICNWISFLCYPTAQSLILIHGNPKLRRKMCRRLTCN